MPNGRQHFQIVHKYHECIIRILLYLKCSLQIHTLNFEKNNSKIPVSQKKNGVYSFLIRAWREHDYNADRVTAKISI
jgi:hypothetical protein